MSELIDNRAERIRTLQRLIHSLHQGEDPQAVKQQLKALVEQCDAGEIAAMEQELMAQGVPVQEIMGMCDPALAGRPRAARRACACSGGFGSSG